MLGEFETEIARLEGHECALAFIRGRAELTQACDALNSSDCTYLSNGAVGSAVRWAPRTDEPAQELRYNDQDALRQVPKAKPNDFHALMESDGWKLTEVGSFIKGESGATQLSMPAIGCSGRRAVRDAITKELIDDLSFNERTGVRRLKKQLKKPADIMTEIYVDELAEGEEGEGEAELGPKEASFVPGNLSSD